MCSSYVKIAEHPGSRWRRLIERWGGWLPLACGIIAAAPALARELWFDEALTLTNFMLPLTPGEIYTHYTIPNNQIVYTLLLKLWDGCYPGLLDWVSFWRLLSLAAALAALALLFRLRRRLDANHPWPALWVLSAFALSGVFAIYATALRGYAVSWLWVALALYGAWRIFHGPRVAWGWGLYIAAALLAVGTVPTNLLALGAVVIYALPWSRKDFLKDGRLWLLAMVPPLALLLFYGPIWRDFAHTFALNEGFAGRLPALAVIYGAIVSVFGLLLLFCWRRAWMRDWRVTARLIVWLLPALAVLLLHRAPFPRVFVPLFPVYAMLLADGVADWRPSLKTAAILAAAWVAVQLWLGWAAPRAASAAGLSVYEDDYFRPWYMAETYSVRSVLPELRQRSPAAPVFLSFNSDPCPVLFYAAQAGLRRDFRADVPQFRVAALPHGALLILRRDENPADFERRFGGALEPLGSTALHAFYRLQLKR